MGRLERLQKEITKNLNNGREVNDVIDGWSPNNLRRLLISPKVIIVEYHVTDSNKTKRLREIIDVEQDFNIELNKAMQDINSYKSILSCLVNTKVGKSTRVFSSIEEIIFFGNYPEKLARLDRNLNLLVDKNKLAQGEPLTELLKSRFIRLNNISIINSLDESAILDLSDKCKQFGSSITLLAKSSQVEGVKSYTINPLDWWRGTYLRPKDYSMDEEDSRLAKYFRENIAKLEEVKKKQEMEDKYKEIQSKKKQKEDEITKKELLSLYNYINRLSISFNELMSLTKDVYDYSSKVDKAEWAGYFSQKNIVQLCKINASGKKMLDDALKGFNIDLLKEMLRENDLDYSTLAKPLSFLDVTLGLVPASASNAEFKKANYEKVFKWLMSTLSNIVYMVLVKYSVKTGNRDKYMSFHVNKLKINSLLYSESIIAFCNSTLKTTDSRKCFGLVEDSNLIADSELNISVKTVEAIKILNQMKNTTKRIKM